MVVEVVVVVVVVEVVAVVVEEVVVVEEEVVVVEEEVLVADEVVDEEVEDEEVEEVEDEEVEEVVEEKEGKGRGDKVQHLCPLQMHNPHDSCGSLAIFPLQTYFTRMSLFSTEPLYLVATW